MLILQGSSPGTIGLGGAVSAVCTPLAVSGTRFVTNSANLGGAASVYCTQMQGDEIFATHAVERMHQPCTTNHVVVRLKAEPSYLSHFIFTGASLVTFDGCEVLNNSALQQAQTGSYGQGGGLYMFSLQTGYV